jgi:hypothetical protein
MILTYHKEGDYLLPNLTVPEAPKLGKYGMLRREYLRKHRNGYYTGLQLSGKLDRHLKEIDQQAKEMVERLVFQMVKILGITEELKAKNQLEWVRQMNNIRASAEEVVLKELIYS